LNLISTVGKPGIKSGKVAAVRSLKNLELTKIEGRSAFATGQIFWGRQLCVNLDLTYCKQSKKWIDHEGTEWHFFFKNPSVMKAITGSMGIVDEWLEEATGLTNVEPFNISVGELQHRYRTLRAGLAK